MGYVEQNDIHTPALTVVESLRFSANLRLDRHVNKRSEAAFVDNVSCISLAHTCLVLSVLPLVMSHSFAARWHSSTYGLESACQCIPHAGFLHLDPHFPPSCTAHCTFITFPEFLFLVLYLRAAEYVSTSALCMSPIYTLTYTIEYIYIYLYI